MFVHWRAASFGIYSKPLSYIAVRFNRIELFIFDSITAEVSGQVHLFIRNIVQDIAIL